MNLSTSFRCNPFLAVLASAFVTATAMGQSGTHNIAPSNDSRQSQSNSSQVTSTGFAVVELFTSQGCSSCPPADVLLEKIDQLVQQGKHDVYVLSFHVDYWNRLGWRDPYSSQKFSQRQRAYASAANSRRVYTPQMIVNGQTEFVGSNQKLAMSAISASLKKPSAVRVELQCERKDNKANVQFQVAGNFQNLVMNVAVVETPAANRVSRGENSGRTLSHVNVVRAFKIAPLHAGRGQLEVELPIDLKSEGAKLIAYAQNPRTLQVVGAATSKL